MHQQLLKPYQLAPGILPVATLNLQPTELQDQTLRPPPESPDPKRSWQDAIQEDQYGQRVLKALEEDIR